MRRKHHTSPIILALLCAVWVHTVLFTDTGHRLQGAITESSEVSMSDSQLILNGDTVSLIVQKDITKVTRLTAALMYNDKSITLSKPESAFGKITEQSEDYNRVVTLAFTSPQDIKKGTTLAAWKITKVLPEIHTINLTDVQIESSEWLINLSTRGTGEF